MAKNIPAVNQLSFLIDRLLDAVYAVDGLRQALDVNALDQESLDANFILAMCSGLRISTGVMLEELDNFPLESFTDEINAIVNGTEGV